VPTGAARFAEGLFVKSDQSPTPKTELSTELAMGGQALIEGVLMRSPYRVAMAARKPDGEIAVKTYPYVPIGRRIKWLGWPVIRGGVSLVEGMKIGMEALTWSAELQTVEGEEKPSGKSKLMDKLAMGASVLVATVMTLGLFMYFPLWVGRWAADGSSDHAAFRQVIINVVAGGVRVSVLLAYLWVISLWKDIHRVFQYHGSEHKSIFAFEAGSELTGDRALTFSRFHPRCGTSFLLIVALSAILFFVIVDSLVVALIGEYPSVLARFLVHLPLIPVLAGISYEFLRYSAKHTANRAVRFMIQPGLWLQRITTQEPDKGMCEVAVTALKTALDKEDPRPVPAAQSLQA
jgi:uncharacterized protein YqhQ